MIFVEENKIGDEVVYDSLHTNDFGKDMNPWAPPL